MGRNSEPRSATMRLTVLKKRRKDRKGKDEDKDDKDDGNDSGKDTYNVESEVQRPPKKPKRFTDPPE